MTHESGVPIERPIAARPADEPRPDPPGASTGLDDPRALQILTTEHWSLIASRSLSYNEAFTRAGMFLTFVSMSLVALALVAAPLGFGREFLLLAAIVFGLDIFVGLATIGRLVTTNYDDLRSIQGMNRLRHAYLELTPGLRPYFSTSSHDDMAGVLSFYGEGAGPTAGLQSLLHGLTTTLGMVVTLTSALAGILAAIAALVLNVPLGWAVVAAIAGSLLLFTALAIAAARAFQAFMRALVTRFPSPPGPDGASAP
jgi:hypothetical protein